jgi:hypothetical protein
MGANRSGVRARQRMKRHKKEMERLARKTAAADGGASKRAATTTKSTGP